MSAHTDEDPLLFLLLLPPLERRLLSRPAASVRALPNDYCGLEYQYYCQFESLIEFNIIWQNSLLFRCILRLAFFSVASHISLGRHRLYHFRLFTFS